jgi:hypothetical protein
VQENKGEQLKRQMNLLDTFPLSPYTSSGIMMRLRLPQTITPTVIRI